jgi:hypothetical protein
MAHGSVAEPDWFRREFILSFSLQKRKQKFAQTIRRDKIVNIPFKKEENLPNTLLKQP